MNPVLAFCVFGLMTIANVWIAAWWVVTQLEKTQFEVALALIEREKELASFVHEKWKGGLGSDSRN